MQYEKIRKTVGIVLVVIILACCFTTEAQSFFTLPTNQRLSVGDKVKLNLNFPKRILANLSVYIEPKSQSILKINGYPLDKEVFKYNHGTPIVTKPGKFDLQLKLFGLIPIRSLHVEVLPKIRLIPGGHSIGILLHAQGVMVVGQSTINDNNKNMINPAKEAGIELGDIILKINGKSVNNDEDVASLIDNLGREDKKIVLTIKRQGKLINKKVEPVLCKETNRYRIGLYVRDSAAGVGTLSFIDPLTKTYGALGHVITDADTNQIIGVGDGKIIKANIQGIQPGTIGHPGEKVGMFVENDQFRGNIERNTNYGLYGKLKTCINNPLYHKALPIALANEIKEGPAEILTVIKGERIQKFNIKIEKVLPEQRASGKGMVIKITDRRLLKETGGIIQGMSGSPIIQNGKIIGAVTHVFVNDPTKGYGILIEWMLTETNIVDYYKRIKDSKIVSIRVNYPDFSLKSDKSTTFLNKL